MTSAITSKSFEHFLTIVIPTCKSGNFWPSDMTIMMRMTSKNIRDIVDNVRVPTSINLIWSIYKTDIIKINSILIGLNIIKLKINSFDFESNQDINQEKKIEVKNQEEEEEEKLLKLSEMISLNEELLELDLSLCELTNNSLKYFKKSFEKLKNLSSLDLDGNDMLLSLDFIKVLLSLPKLVSLDLSANCDIEGSEIDFEDLPEQILQIENLSLSGCLFSYAENIDNIFKLIRISPKLVSIDISDNGLKVEWIESLVQDLGHCPNLTQVDLRYNDIDDEGSKIITKLFKSHKIVSLNLSCNNIGDEGVISIANALSHNPNLTFFDLSTNNFGNEGIIKIGNALSQCPNLTNLNLSYNKFGDEGATNIANALYISQYSKLTHLDLSNNNIGVEGSKSIIKLFKNYNFSTLRLFRNNFGDEGVSIIANAICITPCLNLSYLYLSHNNIGDIGTSSIANALSYCPNLSLFDISYNNIGDIGTSSITNVLFANSLLHYIDLSHNKIGDVGASNIAIALCIKCPNLKNLNLSNNMIGDKGTSKIVNALSYCPHLSFFDISKNSIDKILEN